MKAVSLLVNSYLPDDLKDYSQVYDSKSVNRILYAVALKHPDLYAKLEKQIGDIGRNASYINGETITLGDLEPVIDRKALYDSMDSEIKALPRDRNFTGKRREIFQKYNNIIEKETAKAGLAKRNNIAMSVLSGARGKNPQFKAMVSTPGTYSDYKGETVDVFSKESFADGIRPAMFCASTNGTRASVVSAKVSTAKGGDWAKQMAAISANQVIREQDCKTGNGISLPIDDTSIVGRKLAKDAGKFKAGEFVTREMLASMANDGVKNVVVRSALTCGTKNGLCAHCIGKYFNGGKLPKIGDSVGLVASTSSSEPVTQMALCLEEHTLVRMADGSAKELKDIEPGDMVLGADKNANTFPVKVLDKFDQGVKDVRTHRFAFGQTSEVLEVTSTDDHKFLLNRRVSSQCNTDTYGSSYGKEPYAKKVMRIGDINRTSYAVLPWSYSGGKASGVPGILLYMAGLFMGDGCRFAGEGPARISCADLTLVDNVNAEASSIGMHMIKRKRGFDWDFTRINTCHGKSPYKDVLRRLGFDNKYCHEKRIPDEVFSWSTEDVARFIAGYMDADGSIYQRKDGWYSVNFTSTSKPLITGLRDLLAQRFGIYTSSVYSELQDSKEPGHRARSSITIARQDMVYKFAKSIAVFCLGVKKDVFGCVTLDGYDRNQYGSVFVKYKGAGDFTKSRCLDIEVDHPDHLFVLANGLITSNSAKHTAGMTKDKMTFSGLPVIQQFTQSPEKFKDRATLSEVDGKVDSVEEAPQGGMYVTVAGRRHYVLPGHDVEVKAGDTVEAGDELSEGLADAEDIVRLKGLGAGRKYYADRLSRILEDSGAASDRRNIEIIARGAVNHVRITGNDSVGAYLPDDVVDYNALQATYAAPETSIRTAPSQAVGKYIQEPVLHYSIGTRVTPNVAKDLKDNGYESVLVDQSAPGFEPELVRLRTASHNNRDWLASQATSYLTQQIEDSVVRGDDTNVMANDDYRPRIAYGRGFAENANETGRF